MSVKITYFVHGTTLDNEKKLATGWLPGELSKLGIERVNNLKEILKDKEFDYIFSSDLKRAIDSANILFGDKYDIIHDERLREANFGDWNGTNAKAFKDNLDDFIDKAFPNGETYLEIEKRIKSFCDEVKEKYNGMHIAIVAHEAPQLALEVILKEKTWVQAFKENWRKTGDWQPGWEYEIN